MKGVIVQIGDPKSIVFFNNGKIRAIPTPANCHVGMVVTVKLNNRLKIMVIAFSAVLLLATGVFIGATFLKGRAAAYPAPPLALGDEYRNGPMNMMQHRGGSGRQVQTVTVLEAKSLKDDTLVVLTGAIVQSLGDKKYTFRDSTGDITVEIDKKTCRGLRLDASGTVEISGEVDVEKGQVLIDVKSIRELFR